MEVPCVDSFLAFYRLLDQLCRLPRTGWTLYPQIRHVESVADHTYGTACIALSQTQELNRKARLLLVQTVLMHDLAESLVGDIIPPSLSHVSDETKQQLEADAAEQIAGILCSAGLNKMAKLYEWVFTLYEGNKALVSHAAHLIDKIDMLSQALCYSSRYSVDLKSFFKGCEKNASVAIMNSDAHEDDGTFSTLVEKLVELLTNLTKYYKRPQTKTQTVTQS